ncbi:hypothetical protein JL100_015105 [Skermanella mucosa]|uniref:hypothetical protein n=1 Tax=Skermanella mucosa TaxID=1789672 RepID=UPI00192B3D76|nr:hypothetical protein [Skermanella mucosa]UEM18453.1 hypothetical protein JL100_015105 [Skermanella mucosa]
MADPHVVSALKDKRAELTGRIIVLRAEIAALEQAVKTCDGALALFERPPMTVILPEAGTGRSARSSSTISTSDHPRARSRSFMAYCSARLSRLWATWWGED